MAIAPSIGNAFFDATQVRLTDLPLRPEQSLKS
jgi:CO/xanthine dehydrogenase Mo-binding subunit